MLLQEDMAEIAPMIGEVNAMSCALDKKVTINCIKMALSCIRVRGLAKECAGLLKSARAR